jgi:Flp pilus assembly pilin Flp
LYLNDFLGGSMIVVKNKKRGATALEYAGIAAVIATVIWAAFSQLGQNVSDVFDNVGSRATQLTQ